MKETLGKEAMGHADDIEIKDGIDIEIEDDEDIDEDEDGDYERCEECDGRICGECGGCCTNHDCINCTTCEFCHHYMFGCEECNYEDEEEEGLCGACKRKFYPEDFEDEEEGIPDYIDIKDEILCGLLSETGKAAWDGTKWVCPQPGTEYPILIKYYTSLGGSRYEVSCKTGNVLRNIYREDYLMEELDGLVKSITNNGKD